MNSRLKVCYTQNPTLVCHMAMIDFYSFCLLINESMNNQLHLLKSIFKGLDNKSISYETENPKSMKFNETLIRKFNEKDHKRTEANFATMQQKVILMTKTKSIIINYWKITKKVSSFEKGIKWIIIIRMVSIIKEFVHCFCAYFAWIYFSSYN